MDVAGLHLVKCLASTQGPKIRVNAVSPGILMTEWVGGVTWNSNVGVDVLKGAKLDAEAVKSTVEKSYLRKEVA